MNAFLFAEKTSQFYAALWQRNWSGFSDKFVIFWKTVTGTEKLKRQKNAKLKQELESFIKKIIGAPEKKFVERERGPKHKKITPCSFLIKIDLSNNSPDLS